MKGTRQEMVCIDNNPLDDESIDSVLNQTASSEVLEHVYNCEYCAALVHEHKNLDVQLKARLYRSDCPSSLELAEFYSGMLGDSDMQASIQHHLTLCTRCNDELVVLEKFMADTETTITSEVSNASAKIIKPNFRLTPGNIIKLEVARDEKLRAVRGRSSGPIMATAEDKFTIFVEVDTELGEHTLTGSIVTDDVDAWIDAQVQVFQVEKLVAITSIEELGDFTCQLRDTEAITLRINNKQGKSLVITDIQWS